MDEQLYSTMGECLATVSISHEDSISYARTSELLQQPQWPTTMTVTVFSVFTVKVLTGIKEADEGNGLTM